MFCLYFYCEGWVIFSGEFFFFQAEDGIRDLVRSRGLGDVYKRQVVDLVELGGLGVGRAGHARELLVEPEQVLERDGGCLLYTSDAADERSSVDLGGRRIIKKKNKRQRRGGQRVTLTMQKTRRHRLANINETR